MGLFEKKKLEIVVDDKGTVEPVVTFAVDELMFEIKVVDFENDVEFEKFCAAVDVIPDCFVESWVLFVVIVCPEESRSGASWWRLYFLGIDL